MSADDEIMDGNTPEIEAAEFVLGLTTGEERATAAARVETDPAFASLVRYWELRFASLFLDVSAITPPASVWNGIAEVIAADSDGLPLGSPANENPDIGRASPRVTPASLRFWRGYGVAMTALAAVLLALLVARPPVEPVVITREITVPAPQPTAAERQLLSARIAPEAGIPVAVITFDPLSQRLLIAPVDIQAASDRTPELWYIPEDGTPRPIGAISASETQAVELPSGFTPNATLAISIEPQGGSPTGLPTGPIIGTGTLNSL